MTDHRSPLDAHTESFRTDLHRTGERLRRRRQRRARAALIATPLVIAASVVVAFWPGSDGDVLERAAAALNPTTNVVHFRTQTRSNATVPNPCDDDPVSEDVWLETSGEDPRWRWRQSEMNPRCGTMSTGFGNASVGPTDNAYDGRALVTSSPQGRWVERFTNPPKKARRAPDLSGLWGLGPTVERQDPLSFLRALLGDGRLRVGSRGTVDGRAVFWLVGTDNQRAAVRVAIDPTSYAPVTVIRKIPMSDFVRKNPSVERSVGDELRTDFAIYEPASPRDLAPTLPPGGGKVIDMDWADAQTAMRERMKEESREGHLRALRMQRERKARKP